MKIKILALLLAFLMLSAAAVGCKEDDTDTPPDETPIPDSTESVPDYIAAGEIEDGALTWEFYEDGTLYIKGTGGMTDFILGSEQGEENQPWYAYLSDIKKVVVEDGVTRLAQFSFKYCVNLKEVVLGKGITEIPEKCFSDCYYLKKVEAKSVTVLRELALENCLRLESLTLSASLSLVEQGALSGACEEGTGLTVKLAGTQGEWEAASCEIADAEYSEKNLADALQSAAFVEK